CRARAAECDEGDTCAQCECAPAPFVDPADLPDWPAGDAGAAPGDGCVPTTLYLDEDGDGYGVEASSVSACGPREGYVDRAGDCDDDCADCRPDGTESCDGVRDENCNGAVNEGCPCAPGRPEA